MTTVAIVVLAYAALVGWLCFYYERRRANAASARADAAELLAEMNARYYTTAMNGWRDSVAWWSKRNEAILAGWRAALRLLVEREIDDTAPEPTPETRVH